MLRTWRVQGVCLKISLFYPLWSTLFHLNCCYGLEKKYTHQRTPVLKAVCEPGGPTEKTWQHTLNKLIATWTLFCGGSPRRKACLWRAYRLGSFLSCSVHLGPRGEMWRFAMTFHLATGPLSDHAPKPLWPWPEPSFPFKLTFSGFCHCGGRLTKLSWVVFLIWSDTSYCFYFPAFHLLASRSFTGKTWNTVLDVGDGNSPSIVTYYHAGVGQAEEETWVDSIPKTISVQHHSN